MCYTHNFIVYVLHILSHSLCVTDIKLEYTSMYACLLPAHSRVPTFGWHQGPPGPTKALRALLENLCVSVTICTVCV